MSDHSFQLRLFCRYEDPNNSITDLKVEVFTVRGWKVLDLNIRSAGFLLFVYTILTCQHMFMRKNCAEKGLTLDTANGMIDLLASEDWFVQKMHISFEGKLKSGSPGAEDVDYIIGRMEQCPVSKNLSKIPDSRTTLQLNPA